MDTNGIGSHGYRVRPRLLWSHHWVSQDCAFLPFLTMERTDWRDDKFQEVFMPRGVKGCFSPTSNQASGSMILLLEGGGSCVLSMLTLSSGTCMGIGRSAFSYAWFSLERHEIGKCSVLEEIKWLSLPQVRLLSLEVRRT